MEIARIDESGKLVAVETCSEEDYRTDAAARTVRLEAGHDMRGRIGQYRFDFNRNSFSAFSNEPLEVADRDTSELVEGVIDAIEDIYAFLSAADIGTFKLRLSNRTSRTFTSFRGHTPRKDRRVRLDEDLPKVPQQVSVNASIFVRPAL